MPESAGEYLSILCLIFIGAVYLRIFWKFLRDRCAPVKSVNAEIVDKHISHTFSKTRGSASSYYVVFSADGKRLSFRVSAFSYQGYRVKERGTLTYKGSKLIDFQ